MDINVKQTSYHILIIVDWAENAAAMFLLGGFSSEDAL